MSPDLDRRTRQGRGGKHWLAVQARVWTEETHCWICRRYVDQALPPTHPMGRTADHVTPLWLGGPPRDRSNLRLAHRRCNTVRNNQLRSQLRPREAFTVDATAL